MKKVLIFTTAYAPYVGGAEIAVAEITKRLGQRYIFFMITYRFSRDLPAFENRDGMEIYRLGFGTFIDRWLLFPLLAFWQATKLHRQQRLDLFWAVMVTYASIGAYFAKLVYPSIPLLLTLQEGDPVKHFTYGKLGLLGLWWKLLIGKADYIQAISSYLGDLALRKGARCPVAVVPNGVNVEHFMRPLNQLQTEKYRHFFRLTPNDFVLITVSRLVRKNAVDVILKALTRLEPRCKLLVIGAGKESAFLRGLAKDFKLEERVVFVGEVTHAELPDYLHLSHLFARPSRSEGLGNAFLEAMAAGLPVVGTAVGGITDFLKHEVTGLVCRVDDPQDLAEKIKRLVQDEDLRKRLAVQAANLVQDRFSWTVSTEGMKKIIDVLTAD